MVKVVKKYINIRLAEEWWLRGTLYVLGGLLCFCSHSFASVALNGCLVRVVVHDGNDTLDYKYAYDDEDRLLCCRVFSQEKGVMTLQQVSLFGYDAQGCNTMRTDSVLRDGQMRLEWAYDVIYNSRGDVAQVKCCCPMRETSEMGCDSAFYTYNDNGSLLRYEYVDCDDRNIAQSCIYECDDAGRRIGSIVADLYSDRVIAVSKDSTMYTSDGRVARDVHMEPTTGYRTERVYEYDSLGRCVTVQAGRTAKRDIEWRTKDEMMYDECGNLLYVKGFVMSSLGWVHDKTTVYVYDMEQENVLAPDFDGRLFKGHDLRYGLTENPPCANRLTRIDSFYSDGEEISSVRYFYSDGQNR